MISSSIFYTQVHNIKIYSRFIFFDNTYYYATLYEL